MVKLKDKKNPERRGMMSERDDFWDIEKLIPRKNLKQMQPTRHDTSAVPIEFGENTSEEVKTSLFERAVRDGELKAGKEYTYTPSNSLITSVTVRPRLTPSRFYADFLSDAKKYLNVHASPCESVPFPAYIPEYRSMKRAQLEFYFYFRDCVKKGVKIETPLSYILLLLFEIINLPDEIAPEDGSVLMCRIWLMYRDVYPRLNSYIADWLCDYCLIHRLSLPEEILEHTEILAEASGFYEFYCDPKRTDRYTLLCKTVHHTPNSDGKYPDTEPLLKEHVVRVVDRLADIKRGGAFSPDDILMLTTGARTAYRSALCAYNNNALISYTYRSFSKITLSAQKLGDCVKYAENRVRAYLGIRARLKCPTLADADRCVIDDYFDTELPIEKKKYQRKEYASYMGENEYLYEPESTGVSLDTALEIEKESWKAAQMLEGAFADIDMSEEELETAEEAPVLEKALDGPAAVGLTDTELEFLRLVISENMTALKAFLKQNGLIGDAVSEKINVYAFDTIGDSIIEGSAGEYVIVPDYLEEVEQWLRN